METDTEQDRIFCLNELLRSQVAIAASLEFACQAFRHSDKEFAEAIGIKIREARDLSQQAANIVGRYAEVAQQVSQTVLPDLSLAVQEKEPALAVNFLGMVKEWVVQMKADGEDMQRKYAQLSQGVHMLIRRLQTTKIVSDRKLAEGMQAQISEAVDQAPASPRSQSPLLAIGGGTVECLSSDDEGQMTDDVPRKQATSLGPGMLQGGAVGGGPTSFPTTSAGVVGGLDSAMAPAFTINSHTHQLFEQLSQLASTSSIQSTADVPMLGTGSADADAAAKPGNAHLELLGPETLDLLFMAPGINNNSLPKLQTFRLEPKTVTPMHDDETPAVSRTGSEGYTSASCAAATAPPEIQLDEAQAQDAIVRYIPGVKTTNAAMQEARSLLKVLRELKKVDEILWKCTAFWQNMDGTVQKLAQMKEHTQCLVNFTANSARLRERFEQRLDEYSSFWTSLEKICRQYVSDYQRHSALMYKAISELVHQIEVHDTRDSAMAGMMMAVSPHAR